MANYQDLKDSISALIRQNGAQEITGDVLQGVLVSMVANLGQNYQFKGIAVPTGNPGTPDQNVFYFATQQGTYTNFGGAEIDKDSLFVLAYNGEWAAFDTGISAMPKDLNFLVDSNMAIAPYEDNVTLEMDVYNPSTASSQVKEYEIPSANEEFAGVMSAADKKTLDTLKDNARRYDYMKINGLTTSSTSEQVKAALTPIDGTEVVFPTNGNTITNGNGISIEILAATSNTFSYIHNNQLVTLGFSLAEGREAVTSKVQTSLLKPMYDFSKINALTGESGNDEIEAAIKQLQTSTTTAPSAGALLVDATSLAPLAVVTESSSDALTMKEVFSYTHGGVKYTVEISGAQGELTAKVTTQAVTQRRYYYEKFVLLNKNNTPEEIKDGLTPIGETEPVLPTMNDLLVDANGNQVGCFVAAGYGPSRNVYSYFFQMDVILYLCTMIIDKLEDGTYQPNIYKASAIFEKLDSLSTLQSTVTQQGTQIQSNTKGINDLHKMDVISDSVQVVFKQYLSRETGKEEKEFMIQAPKGLLSGEEKVKLYRKLATRYKATEDTRPFEHRVKSGWIGYKDLNSDANGSQLYELEAVPFESSNPSPYHDYFRIVKIEIRYNPEQYIETTFDEILRSKCTLVMDEDTGTWKHVSIMNGRKAKKLLNFSYSNVFYIPVSFVTWGVQLTTNKGEAYTPIMPFKVRYQMGNPAHQGKFTEKEAAEFTLDDLYISMSK